jgi:hypothetical protein
MKHLEKLKETLCEELDKFAKSGDVTVNSLEKIHKLTDTIKNIDKIMMFEEDGGYSEGYMDDGAMYGNSYARSRRYAKRDSMGRYSRDGGYSEDDDYSERRMGRGYSRDEASDRIMHSLGELMEGASPKERETLKKWMRELERD